MSIGGCLLSNFLLFSIKYVRYLMVIFFHKCFYLGYGYF